MTKTNSGLRNRIRELKHEINKVATDKAKCMSSRIKQKRKDSQLTQAELATFLAISRTQLTNIEVGNAGTSIKTLIKICDVLGTDPNYLLGYE